jgi:hypothetical protein
LIGVVSLNPAYIGNEVISNLTVELKEQWAASNILLSMTGRVMTRVNTEGGPIMKGDRITQSSTPGVGMKATTSARTIGIALSDFSGEGEGEVYLFIGSEYTLAPGIGTGLDALFASTTDAVTTEILNATSTGTSTDPISNFFRNIFAKMTKWFADATNGITEFFAKRVHTEEICVAKSDGTEVCITGDQLEDILSGQAAGAAASGNIDTPTPPSEDPGDQNEQPEQPNEPPVGNSEPVNTDTSGSGGSETPSEPTEEAPSGGESTDPEGSPEGGESAPATSGGGESTGEGGQAAASEGGSGQTSGGDSGSVASTGGSSEGSGGEGSGSTGGAE